MDRETKLKEVIRKANKELCELQLKSEIQRKNKLIGRYFKHLGHIADTYWWTYFHVRSVDELGKIHTLMISNRSDYDVQIQFYWTTGEDFYTIEIDSYEFWMSFDRMMELIRKMINK